MNPALKFPLKFNIEDFSGSMRGQGKRVNGMVTGSMSARVGKSASVDVGRTFGLVGADEEEVKCLNQWEFNVYRRQREAGDDHATAITTAYTECNP
jgi:hypothetical protein